MPVLETLSQLRVFPLNLHCETTGTVRLPPFAGGLFRSGFGYFFRDLVCTTFQPTCANCPVLVDCPYSAVFETPVLVEKFPILRKYPNAPHPFVLAPPTGAGGVLAPGAAFQLGLTLIGSATTFLPHYIRCLDDMGRSGRFGGAFRVRSVTSALAGEQVIYDSGTGVVNPNLPALEYVNSNPVGRMTLWFLTPLRMRTRGEYNLAPDFVAIAHALLHRTHMLAAIYGDVQDSSWTRPLMAQADRIVTEEAKFRVFEWDRRSGRQDRRIAMDGVLGSMTVTGELTELAPFFRLGEWIHIGSGTSMGLGKYRVEFQE